MRQGPPWVPLALLAVGVVGVIAVVAALAAGDDGENEPAATAATVATAPQTVTAVETETVDATETATEPTSVVVPDVTGQTLVEAGETAESAGLVADSFPVENDAPAGTVVAQEPASETEVAPTRRLRLNVSVGPEAREMIRVPDVTGPKAPRARRIAWERGFTTLTADRDAPSAEEVDEVILQEPAAGTRAPALTQITLYVGR